MSLPNIPIDDDATGQASVYDTSVSNIRPLARTPTDEIPFPSPNSNSVDAGKVANSGVLAQIRSVRGNFRGGGTSHDAANHGNNYYGTVYISKSMTTE
jgi:hypothetical protein